MSMVEWRQVDWKQVELKEVTWRDSNDTTDFPRDLILYMCAKDGLKNQIGNQNPFASSVLGPQYVRAADGSYTNAGAVAPVDVIDGRKMLRTCGAVENKFVSGSFDFAASQWLKRGTASVAAILNNANLFSGIGSTGNDVYYYKTGLGSSVAISAKCEIKRVSTSGILTIANPAADELGELRIDLSLLGDDFVDITTSSHPAITVVAPFVADAAGGGGLHFLCFTGAPISFYARNPQLTIGSYPLPYTPPGTTMPASHATTTNGPWFAMADGSPVWDALSGGPMTLATRVRMGVGSGDLPNSSVLNALTPDDVAGRFLTIQKSAGGVLTASLSDGTNTATVPLAAWARGDVLQFFPQVQTGETQMRLGYKTSVAESITWGDLATYAGSFGPDTTLDKLMLGYANTYPMHFDTVAMWNTQADDATILKWMKP